MTQALPNPQRRVTLKLTNGSGDTAAPSPRVPAETLDLLLARARDQGIPLHPDAQIASLLANRNMVREFFAGSPLVHIKSIAHTKSDERFLELLNETISTRIEDTEMDVEKLASLMNMSRVTLYRKIKAISDLSPLELINIMRLKKAAELLAAGDYKIYEIAAIVGYSSQSNFARNFVKQFKMTPSEYMNSMVQKKQK